MWGCQKRPEEVLCFIGLRQARGDVKVVLGDFNTQIDKDAAFLPTIEKSVLHQESKDNGTRVINFEEELRQL